MTTLTAAPRAALVAAALTLAACGGNPPHDGSAQPTNPAGPGDEPAVPDSLRVWSAPADRTQALIDNLNAYRASTFQRAEDVASSSVLYTSAVRHAMYLDSIDSKGWEPVPPPGGNPPEGDAIIPTTKYFVLQAEDVRPLSALASFPALFTNTDLFDRIEAIAGGQKLLDGVGTTRSEVYEADVFNGSVWRSDGKISDFRGFNLDTRQVADPSRYVFDAVDNLWYSRRGRAILSRAALRYIGYGQVDDDHRYLPPYPILNGRLRGVLDAISSRPLTAQFGFWPNVDDVGAKSVTAYGTDTDVNGPNQFSGVPIHMTLPVAEPIRRDNGVVTCSLKRVDAPVTRDTTWRWFALYSNVDGLNVPTTYVPGSAFDGFEYRARGLPSPVVSNASVSIITVLGYNGNPPDTYATAITLDPSVDFSKFDVGDQLVLKIKAGGRAGTYQYTITGKDVNSHAVTVDIPSPAIVPGDYANDITNVTVDVISRTASGVSALVDPNLRDGEFYIVPVAPLEPNARYEVSLQLRTASYDSGPRTWQFETNDKTNDF